ncbi:MAG: YHYH domain-containing protein, partial [Candidatus Moranbacteria bacterium]|nr:YHYH domain-containing protein [Candidatus Moranbacteria bacterium]
MVKGVKFSIFLSAVFLAVFIFSINIVFAHPGGTDSSGCHTCRTNCASWGLATGEYHCHNAKAVPQTQEPIKSTYGANGTGHTDPAPEYKNNSATSATKNLTSSSTAQNSSSENNGSWLGGIALLGIGGGAGYWISKK